MTTPEMARRSWASFATASRRSSRRSPSTADAVDDSCLHGDFPLDAQEALAREVVAGLPLPDDA